MTSHTLFRDESLRALLEVMPEISRQEERQLAENAVHRIRRENARDSVLSSAAELLRRENDSLPARLQVASKAFWPDAAGARTRLFEMVTFGADQAQRRSLARKARRAEARRHN